MLAALHPCSNFMECAQKCSLNPLLELSHSVQLADFYGRCECVSECVHAHITLPWSNVVLVWLQVN